MEYLPVEDGEYTINVLFADVHVPGSPFKAIVSSDFDASKVNFVLVFSGLILEDFQMSVRLMCLGMCCAVLCCLVGIPMSYCSE